LECAWIHNINKVIFATGGFVCAVDIPSVIERHDLLVTTFFRLSPFFLVLLIQSRLNNASPYGPLSNAELLGKVKAVFFAASWRNDEVTLWTGKETAWMHIPPAVNQVWELFLTREGHKSQFLDAITRFIAPALISIETDASNGMRDLLEESFQLGFAAASAPR
jgi:hypothetical protein